MTNPHPRDADAGPPRALTPTDAMNQWRVTLRYGRQTEVITIDAPTAEAGWAAIADWLLGHWGFGLISVEVVG